jgi:hypothetical protein
MKESWISVDMEPLSATQSVASLDKEIGEEE